jgi:spore germination protein YaaH
MTIPCRILTFLCLAIASLSAQPQALFYMTDTPDSVRSYLSHASKIHFIVPTTYSVDEQGLVWGKPNALVVEASRKNGAKLMPIIVNPGFNQEKVHQLLSNAAARARMNQSLLKVCREYKFYGIQFDFENIAYTDRELFTQMVRETSDVLGQAGFKLSIAVVPPSLDAPGKGDYARWMHMNWRGSFDLGAIAKHVDFISLMTYDEHTRHTPPGPIAGMPWVEQHLKNALGLVRKEKLSMGIALYGRRWHAGLREKDPAIMLTSASVRDALDLARQMNVTPLWDDTEKAPWFFFYRDGNREYVHYEDARSFQERYNLVKRQGLHGFSAWVLGVEDPQLWNGLPDIGR